MEQNITMQELKEQRLTPAEKFVLDTIKGVKPSKPDWYGDVAWYKDDACLFKQIYHNSWLCVSNVFIREILEKEYGVNYSEGNKLLTKLLHKYTNNGELHVF
jgi:hypothetical protein